MENASKALIIAAAVIISILLVGFAMVAINQGRDNMGSMNLNPQEIAAHNSKFESFEGSMKGTTLRTMLGTIANNNDEYDDRKIKVTSTTFSLTDEETSTKIRGKINAVNNKKTYKVQFGYNTNGIIDKCTIN